MASPSPSSILTSKRKQTPPAHLARDREGAAHRFDQPAGDRQPQPGSALLARAPRIDLVEGLEEALLLGRGNARTGVLDLESQGELPIDDLARLLDGQCDLPPLGELEPVADEIEQDLAELAGVAPDEVGHIAGNPGLETQTFLGRPEAHQGLDVLDQLSQLEVPRLQENLPGFDLRVVEDVVEDTEQRLAR